PGTHGITDPLTFTQFNPSLGTLTGVSIEFISNIHEDFVLQEVPTPITTLLIVASTEQTIDPNTLLNPTSLTDGPVVTLKGPDGITPLFDPHLSTMPVAERHVQKPSGTFSSMLPPGDPNYVSPENAAFDLKETFTMANGASVLSQFTGTGTVALDV